MRFLLGLLAAAALCAAAPQVEEGEINGAKYRIDVPENWSGVLVMFCHGYSDTPTTPRGGGLLAGMLANGAAVAQSGYATGGWAIAEAIPDTEALRRHFIRKFGKPKQTFISGGSMGGHLTVAILESQPDVYDGGLSLCGATPPALWFMQKRVFDLRVVFDYYFPGLYPPLDDLPKDYKRSKEMTAKVIAALDAKPEPASVMRRVSGLRTNAEVASVLDFYTSILAELNVRAGGNAFDNRDVIYETGADDNALNDGVKRYSAKPSARLYLSQHYTTTGQLRKPLLAIQTTYDPLIPGWVTNQYSSLVQLAGAADLFAQYHIKRDGHCTFTGDEVKTAFEQLVGWVNSGKKPLGR